MADGQKVVLGLTNSWEKNVPFSIAYQQEKLHFELLKPNLCTLIPKKSQRHCECEGTPLSLVIGL